jgi:hypothetical protein
MNLFESAPKPDPAAEVTREQLAAVLAGSPPAPLIFQRPTNNQQQRT